MPGVNISFALSALVLATKLTLCLDSQTIGIVTAAAATIYCVFLVYFDWIKTSYLPTFRQQIWSLLHFPFHLAMVLFMQGFTQFIIWSKIMDTLKTLELNSVFDDIDSIKQATTDLVVDSLYTMINKFFEDYPPKYTATIDNVQWAVGNISLLPDSFWPDLATYLTTFDDNDITNGTQFYDFITNFMNMSTSMENSLIETFGIDLVEEVTDANKNVTESSLESEVNIRMWARFDLVVSILFLEHTLHPY